MQLTNSKLMQKYAMAAVQKKNALKEKMGNGELTSKKSIVIFPFFFTLPSISSCTHSSIRDQVAPQMMIENDLYRSAYIKPTSTGMLVTLHCYPNIKYILFTYIIIKQMYNILARLALV